MTVALTEPAETKTPRAVELSGEVVAWVVASALFVGLRLGTVWHSAVGGAELDSLSGAWQARIGQADDRYVPTLFQGLASVLLRLDDSEVWPRLVALLSVSSLPIALYILRSRLGRAGALLALLLVAIDAPLISLGTSASAMGFDVAITTWVFVMMTRPGLPRWLFGVAGFAVATAGPIALPLLAANAGVRAVRREYPEPRSAIIGGIGAALGIVVATFRFGLGANDGLRIPPFDAFAASMSDAWSSPNTFQVALLYSAPVVVGGIAAVAVAARRLAAQREAASDGLTLLVWAGVALLWFLAAATSHSPVPVVALTLPLSLVLGPALVEAVGAMVRADWEQARILIPAAALAALVAVSFAEDGAHNAKLGDSQVEILVAGLCLGAISALGVVASRREARPTLFAAGFAVAAFPALSGALGIGFGAGNEPIPSPYSTTQARQLRETALETVASQGGSIVVHPELEKDVTWPFRDSGKLVIASRVPSDGTFVLWPASAPAPEGLVPLAGTWELVRSPDAPVSDFLDYLRWFTSRGTLENSSTTIAVYVRAKQ